MLESKRALREAEKMLKTCSRCGKSEEQCRCTVQTGNSGSADGFGAGAAGGLRPGAGTGAGAGAGAGTGAGAGAGAGAGNNAASGSVPKAGAGVSSNAAPGLSSSSSSVAKMLEFWKDPASEEEDGQLQPGDLISHQYQIMRCLGSGGMSTVYQARDLTSEEVLAIKMLNSEISLDDEARKRFEREVLSMSRLRHENLLAMKGYGQTPQGHTFFVMEYLTGRSLATELIRKGPLEPRRACGIFLQVCAGMAHVHEAGIIHRDLKPGNIYLVGQDGVDRVKVLDFGIAKMEVNLEGHNNTLTQVGQVLGSPRYMSPEQCTGMKLDSRSDIYSLGCVMYQALTGQTPFNGENALNILFKQVNERPPAFSVVTAQPLIPPVLEAIIMRALAKSPNDRHQTMSALAEELQRFLDSSN